MVSLFYFPFFFCLPGCACSSAAVVHMSSGLLLCLTVPQHDMAVQRAMTHNTLSSNVPRPDAQQQRDRDTPGTTPRHTAPRHDMAVQRATTCNTPSGNAPRPDAQQRCDRDTPGTTPCRAMP